MSDAPQKKSLKGKNPLLRTLQIALAVAVGLVFACWLVVWQGTQDKERISEMREEASQVEADKNVPPHTAKIGGSFSLLNQDGKMVSDADFRGKYLLVYFGYTYCPDVCPTGLQGISRVMDLLDAQASKVQPLYITIDPARDTAAKIKDYISSFHPRIIGLTGSDEQIASVAKAYQVYYRKGEIVDGKDYLMDHSSAIYLMGPNGEFISTFNEESDPEIIVKALQTVWAEKPAQSKP